MATLLKIDDKEIKEALKKLNKIPNQIPKASASAINRTITFANKRLKQEVRKEYTIKNNVSVLHFRLILSSYNRLSPTLTR